MGVQSLLDNKNVPLILSGNAVRDETATIAQDALRVTPLVFGTVMSRNAATQRWVPMSAVNAITGESSPKGIFIGSDISAATIVNDDVANQIILVGMGVTVDRSQVVLEGALNLTTIITAVPWASTATIEDVLALQGIFLETTIAISSAQQ